MQKMKQTSAGDYSIIKKLHNAIGKHKGLTQEQQNNHFNLSVGLKRQVSFYFRIFFSIFPVKPLALA